MHRLNSAQWSRFHELARGLDELPISAIPGRLASLEASGESVDVVAYLRLNYRLPQNPKFDVGARLADRYIIRGFLGEGGMGVVYRASQEITQRDVALKTVHPGLLLEGAAERFRAEIGMLGQLDHPGIVRVFDADVHRGGGNREILFYAMELVNGMPIHEFVAANGRDPVDVLSLFSRVVDAVSYAHKRGVVHRDLKPQNIYVDDQSRPVVLDFGLAGAADQALEDASSPHRLRFLRAGTPGYASPERFRFHSFDMDQEICGDVYSLGVVLYELLTGTRAFEFSDDVSYSEISSMRRGSKELKLADELTDIVGVSALIRRATAPNPEHRFKSAQDFLARIREVVQGRERQLRRNRKPREN